MASVEGTREANAGNHGPKLRSRKDGAAVALDELDKRLLNLMQGSFPIATQAVPARGRRSPGQRIRGDDARPATARRADHPPGHADLRHARARLSVDAGGGQGRSRESVARGERDQCAPGRVAQLPAQSRIQHLVHDRDRARLEAGPAGHARSARSRGRSGIGQATADVEAVQDPDGSRDGGRDRGAREGRRGGGARGDRAPALRRVRRAGDPRHPGRPADHPRAICALRPPSSGSIRSNYSSSCARCRSAACCAGSPQSCFTAGQGSARMAWASGGCPTNGCWRSGCEWRRSVGSRTAISARPTPTGPTRCSRWPTAVPRTSATRSSTRLRPTRGISDRATLYSSTEFKKIRLLYFTSAHRDWEREHAGV